jgi:hypothetical protein
MINIDILLGIILTEAIEGFSSDDFFDKQKRDNFFSEERERYVPPNLEIVYY